jgi:predicted ATP-grasp superfamily ATP-dependent carboligase
MATILVTDGDERSALAVVRSLGRSGHRVVVAAQRVPSLAGSSRFASESVVLPSPLASPDRFAELAGELVRRFSCALVIPITDASALALLARPDSILPALVPMPSLDAFRRASDKADVARTAGPLGIRVPRQVIAVRTDDVAGFAASRAISPPLVLKPSRSVTDNGHGISKHGVVHAADWPTAVRRAEALPGGAYPLLLQERIIGPGLGVFLLVWEGRLLAAFAHRRLREKPPAGGVSVLSESVSLSDSLRDRSHELLKQFQWNGVAMVEYKVDEGTGEPVLMEINGRFWGSLQLAIDAGVDFPALLTAVALGDNVVPVTSWRQGVRCRWYWGYLDYLLARFRRSASALDLPPDAPGMATTLLDLLRVAMPVRDQVLARDDMGPALRELRDRLHLG